MKQLMCIPALLLLACGSAQPTNGPGNGGSTTETTSGPPEAKPLPLAGQQVVFYNVENLFDTEDDPATDDQDFLPGAEQQWTAERLNTKLDRLAEAIGFTGEELPVLVGLCEVENKAVVERLVRGTALKSADYGVAHHDSPDERGVDVGLLFDQDIFQLVRSEALKVPLGDDRTRDILHAELRSRGHTFHVFVNHWPSRREGQEKSEPKRMAAARVLKSAVEGLPVSEDHHVIIMGDFNDTPLDRSIQEGLGAGCALDNDHRLVDLMCLDQPQGHGSHQYNGHWDYLDQFILSQGLAAEVKVAKALWDDRLLFNHPKYGPSPDKTYSGGRYKGGYSDHLPVVLSFK